MIRAIAVAVLMFAGCEEVPPSSTPLPPVPAPTTPVEPEEECVHPLEWTLTAMSCESDGSWFDPRDNRFSPDVAITGPRPLPLEQDSLVIEIFCERCAVPYEVISMWPTTVRATLTPLHCAPPTTDLVLKDQLSVVDAAEDHVPGETTTARCGDSFYNTSLFGHATMVATLTEPGGATGREAASFGLGHAGHSWDRLSSVQKNSGAPQRAASRRRH